MVKLPPGWGGRIEEKMGWSYRVLVRRVLRLCQPLMALLYERMLPTLTPVVLQVVWKIRLLILGDVAKQH
jgi:hypothetical protein